ncbi:raffinose synthase [Dendrobium catenatum]|uniref:Raffinose synthase n=1 Tax=Dendrobium catenatum TaxID=906689 RepID=A0A2I0VD40_9ASPA|nr:raffinose synthase [Dendrobium catenatum]
MSLACPSSRSTFSRVRLPNDLPNDLLIAVLQAEEDLMAISSSARVLERKLVVVGCTILSSVSGNLISSSVVSSSPVEVFFLAAQLFDLSSRHVLSPGILRLARSI